MSKNVSVNNENTHLCDPKIPRRNLPVVYVPILTPRTPIRRAIVLLVDKICNTEKYIQEMRGVRSFHERRDLIWKEIQTNRREDDRLTLEGLSKDERKLAMHMLCREKARERDRQISRKRRGKTPVFQGTIGDFFTNVWNNPKEEVAALLEDLGCFALTLLSGNVLSMMGSALLILRNRCKDFSNKVKLFVTNLLENLGTRFQGDSGPFEDGVGLNDESFISKWKTFQDSKIMEQVLSVYTHVTAFCIHGFDVSKKKLPEILKDCPLTKLLNLSSFFHTIVSGVQFVATRLQQAYHTGSLSALFHSQDSYGKWTNEACEVMDRYSKLTEIRSEEDKHTWIKDCCRVIKEGECIIEMGKNYKKHNKAVAAVRAMVTRLHDVKTKVTVVVASREIRPQPFSILIEGDTSVGKSSFGRVCFKHFAEVRGKSSEIDHIFYPDADNKYMDNYDSSQYCFWIDDVACLKANHVLGPDSSVTNIIKWANIIPSMAICADLSEKGKNPILPEMLIATSNLPEMGMKTYYEYPSAAARRLPMRFTITPKDEYRQKDGVFLDGTKCDPQFGYLPDYWNIVLSRMKPVKAGGSDRHNDFVYEVSQTFKSMNDFLPFLTKEIKQHFSIQDKVLDSSHFITSAQYCKKCIIPQTMCGCISDEEFMETCFQAGYGPYISRETTVSNSPVSGKWVLRFCALLEQYSAWIHHIGNAHGCLQFLYNYVCAFIGIKLYFLLIPCLPFIFCCISTFLVLSVMNPVFMLTMLCRVVCLEVSKDSVVEAVQVISRDIITDLSTRAVDLIRKMGKDIYFQLGGSKMLLLLIGAIPIGAGMLVFIRHFRQNVDVEFQGNVFGMGKPRASLGEVENVWKRDTFPLDSFDIPRPSTSLCTKSKDEISEIFSRFTVLMKMRVGKTDRGMFMRGLLLGGNKILTTKHTVPDDLTEVSVLFVKEEKGVTSNVKSGISARDIRCKDDVCVVNIRDMQPRRSLEQWMPKRSFAQYVGPGMLLTRSDDGAPSFIPIERISNIPSVRDDVKNRLWKCDGLGRETEFGDCGSILLALTPSGPVIVGMHQLGGHKQAFSIDITHDDYRDFIMDNDGFCAGTPNLTCANPKVGNLGELHRKSPLRYMEQGSIRTYGSFDGFRSQPRSRLCQTPLCEKMMEEGFELKHGQPCMAGYELKTKNLEGLTSQTIGFNHVMVDAITEVIVDEWMAGISDVEKGELDMLTLNDAINGVDGLKYIDAMNFSTSAGFPWKTSKRALLVNPHASDERMFVQEIIDRVQDIFDSYARGEMSHCVFTASLKDEARKFEKIRAKNTRVFMGAPVDFLIVMRMLYLPLIRVIQNNKTTCEMAPGTEAQSVEWDILGRYLRSMSGGKNCVAGDYGNFDITTATVVILAAFTILNTFAARCGVSQEQQNGMEGVKYDVSYATVDFFGELLQLIGKNPSGQGLTVIINGLANSVDMRVAWCRLHPDADKGDDIEHWKRIAREFRKHVALLTYGDDNALDVSDDCPWYNHTAIADTFVELGIKYTMADKEAESIAYIPFKDVSFLKRRWRFEEELGHHVAPLDLESIHKMLMLHIPSRVVSSHQQMCDVLVSANDEAFWHGRKIFDEWHSRLQRYAQFLDIKPYEVHLLTWDELIERAKKHDAAYYKAQHERSERIGVPAQFNFQAGMNMYEDQFLSLVAPKQECSVRYEYSEEYMLMCLYNVIVPFLFNVTILAGLCAWWLVRFAFTFNVNNLYLCMYAFIFVLFYHMLHWVPSNLMFAYLFRPRYHFQGCCGSYEVTFPCVRCGQIGCILRLYPDEEDLRNCSFCGACRFVEGDLDCPVCGRDDTCILCGECLSVDEIRANSLVCMACTYDFRADEEAEESRHNSSQRTHRELDDDVRFQGKNDHMDAFHGEHSSTLTTPLLRGEEKPQNSQNSVKSGLSDLSIERPANTTEEMVLSNDPVMDSKTITETQTTVFMDSEQGDIVTFRGTQDSLPNDDRNEANLGDFLKRPTLINTFVWNEGGFGETTFDPWSLFLNSANIKYKLHNFAFFRGTLKLKILINASPFYYGALRLAYLPLHSQVLPLYSLSNKYIPISQQPGVWLFPQDNAGAEMTLPFIWHRNYARLTSSSDIAALGRLTAVQYTALESANGAVSNGCTIQIYAWCEDAVITGPTVGLALQGKVDEYGNGPISAPASALSDWMKYFTKIPVIGRFARATQIGASATSQIATLFGWTNVPVIENVRPVKNLPFHDLASAHISEPTSKFTLDPKSELSVDPRIVGVDADDELAMSSILSRESYLTQSRWATTDGIGTLKFTARVHPSMIDVGTASSAGTYQVAFTPMGYVANLFEHWRGDIIFRFKVVCSKYHKGRLRITWDPTANISAVTDYSNIAFTQIVDLTESNEIEFRVPYMQATHWSKMTTMQNNWSTTGYSTPVDNTMNGSLTLRVLTNLSAPIDTSSVSIFVFVRGAENLEMANPCRIDNRLSPFPMQGGEGEYDSTPHADQYLINWGEAVSSLRLLLRRSVLYDKQVVDITPTGDYAVASMNQTRYPAAPGYDPGGLYTAKGVETTGTTYPYTYANFTPIAYLGCAFLANRGALRWHYNLDSGADSIPTEWSVTRRTNSGVNASRLSYTVLYSTLNSISTRANAWWRSATNHSGATGTVVTNSLTQSGMSVEMPMMIATRFATNLPANWINGASFDETSTDMYTFVQSSHPLKTTVENGDIHLTRWVSAGTDFNLHFFVRAPMLTFNVSTGNDPV